MPTKTQQNVTVRAGETRPLQITVRDEDGVDVDVDGDIIVYRIARHGRTTAPHYLVDLNQDSEQITVEDNGSGVLSVVRYDPGRDDLVQVGKHTHELRITKTGNDTRVVMVGSFTIMDSISD